MIKKKSKEAGKKAKKNSTAKKPAGKSHVSKAKKQINPVEVRKDIANIVGSGAKEMAAAVMGEALKGQLAPTKYLWEVAGVWPPTVDGERATEEEDCLAKLLLSKIEAPPQKPAAEEEDKAEPAQEPAEKKSELPVEVQPAEGSVTV